jgi:hypothetical protein
MDQTAVEWIEGYLKKFNYIEDSLSLRKAFEKAKKMEEEQRKQDVINTWNSAAGGDAFSNAEQYYTSTFKSE